MAKDNWGEFNHPAEDWDDFLRNKDADKTRRARRKRGDEQGEVGVVPPLPPEIEERKQRYLADITHIHEEIFKESSGIKPLCADQIDSCRHSEHWINSGGKICKAEPRSFGKTSRSTNEALMGVLQGKIPYLLILGSTLEKAIDIATSMATELQENQQLGLLYPKVQQCFIHHNKNTRLTHQQTYDGEPTKISVYEDIIRFPVLPDEPSSGAVIQIRPKTNVRGIYQTIETGPDAGKRVRPTHVLLDDIQTDEDAANPKRVEKIIRLLKRSVFRSGTHNRRLAIMMTCTPIQPGDVSHHFLLNEPGWQTTTYQMLKSRSLNENLWLEEYAALLLNFDKKVPGDYLRASLEALDYYKTNQKEMDEGAEATWEWCYEWQDDPQLEISAIQHAYNIMILEGMDVFENECQCNVTAHLTDGEISYMPATHIEQQILPRRRCEVPLDCTNIVTHIDIGMEYFTAVTVASGRQATGNIIDIETYPPFPGYFAKGKVSRTISHLYPTVPVLRDRLYLALVHFLRYLGQKEYKREDGVPFQNKLIGVDSSWEPSTVYKAIRESEFRNVCIPVEGESYKAKDRQMAEKRYQDGSTMHHYCVEVPTKDGTLMKLIVDVNFMKTQTHIMWERIAGTTGSLSLYEPDNHIIPRLVGEHCTAEMPMMDICPRTGRKKVTWTEIKGRDNELFDNIVGTLALLSKLGCKFDVESDVSTKTYNMQEYMDNQKHGI